MADGEKHQLKREENLTGKKSDVPEKNEDRG